MNSDHKKLFRDTTDEVFVLTLVLDMVTKSELNDASLRQQGLAAIQRCQAALSKLQNVLEAKPGRRFDA